METTNTVRVVAGAAVKRREERIHSPGSRGNTVKARRGTAQGP